MREVLQVRLLVEDDEVDVVLAAQAVVHDRQPGVGVRRQPDPNDAGGQREQRVDEARPLVGEPVVVVPPAGAREQDVERRHRYAPREVLRVLEPLDVLDGHRRRHHRERLVGREDPVPAAQEVTLEPTGAEVLGQDLHDPAVGGDLLVRRSQRRLEDSGRSSRRRPGAGCSPSRPDRTAGTCPPPSSVTSAAYTSRMSSPMGRVLSWVVTPPRTSSA